MYCTFVLIYSTEFYRMVMFAGLLLGLCTPLLRVMDGSVTLSLRGIPLQQLDADYTPLSSVSVNSLSAVGYRSGSVTAGQLALPVPQAQRKPQTLITAPVWNVLNHPLLSPHA